MTEEQIHVSEEETFDYGARKGRSLTFEGYTVAVKFPASMEVSQMDVLGHLFSAMIQTRIKAALDEIPVLGHWRRFWRWRRGVSARKLMKQTEQERIRDLAIVQEIALRYTIDTVREALDALEQTGG